MEKNSEIKSLKDEGSGGEDNSAKEVTMTEANESMSPEDLPFVEGGKKDSSLRRQELLVGSGLAEVC